jgi:hypothetical protein
LDFGDDGRTGQMMILVVLKKGSGHALLVANMKSLCVFRVSQARVLREIQAVTGSLHYTFIVALFAEKTVKGFS